MSNKDESKVNISTAPDYAQLAKANSNTAIIEYALNSMRRRGFGFKSLFSLFGQVFIALVIKSAIDNSAIDNFKLTDVMFLKYMYQKFRYGEKTYDIIKIIKKEIDKNDKNKNDKNDKYVFNDIELNTGFMDKYFAPKGVHIDRPGIYYYPISGYYACVNVSEFVIKIKIPRIGKPMTDIQNILSDMKVHVQMNNCIMTRMGVNHVGAPTNDAIKHTYAYETDNYRTLREIIGNNFRHTKALSAQRRVLSIVFNGEPGMGKTTFGNYMAGEGEADLIVIANMIQFMKFNSFVDIIAKIGKHIETMMKDHVKEEQDQKIIIIIDELEKYFKGYCDLKIAKLQEDARKGTEISSGKKTDKDDKDVIMRYPEKLSPEEIKIKTDAFRSEILTQMYEISEGLSVLKCERNITIIYNTNHYEEFMEGADVIHDALRQRMMKFYFHKMEKKQVIDFLKDMRRRLREIKEAEDKRKLNNINSNEQELNIDPKTYDISDELLESIPDDIKISCRVLNDKIISISNYNLNIVIEKLKNTNNWKDDSSYTLGENKVKDDSSNSLVMDKE